MRVLKFGGTSLANAECFLRVVDILESNAQSEQIAIVLSAPAKITNNLVSIIDKTIQGQDPVANLKKTEKIFYNLINNLFLPVDFLNNVKRILELKFFWLNKMLQGIQLLGQCPANINAQIICTGEMLSVTIMQSLLEARNHNVVIINPVKKLLAIGNYLESTVDISESTKRIQSSNISSKCFILMAGFTAGNEKGELVALGRNGSDYSAAVLAACLHAKSCEIWTDVDGIYTCDPRQVPDTSLLSSLSYQEAMELSYFGAKVLHPRTIAPIAQFQIPCFIKNTNKPNNCGTFIGKKIKNLDTNPVRGITNLDNMAMFNISGSGIKGMIGMAARVFSALSITGISVILITQSSSEYSISFCISQNDCLLANNILNHEFSLELKLGLVNPLEIVENLSIISVVGDGMRTLCGIAAKFFSALACANINIIAIAQGSSERSISVVIKNNEALTGVRVVHQMLFSANRVIEVFIIGIGGVGKALLEQITRQQLWLKNKNIDLKVCGIANSHAIYIDGNGINLQKWQQLVSAATEKFSVTKLYELVKKYHLINPIIVDCTASQKIADQYIDFINYGFHVVTPNKKANTSSWNYYQQIRTASRKLRRKFLYETNVGAGLPVIENLQNLFHAGDELIKFSGILSGSLSFIFGKLDEGLSFSKATQLAWEMGFTEPDPREDLFGMDVARKLLILAREAGYKLELTDINVEKLLPPNFTKINNIQDFMKQLSTLDNQFALKVTQAHSQGKVLRFIGEIQKGGICTVKIHAISHDDPLHKVKDGENALAFYSRYYRPRPLVLRGYGAGNNVTAAGVFADLLRISS